MASARVFDSRRDNFLATLSSKPPSKFDSIEVLERDVNDSSTIAFKASAVGSHRTGTTSTTTGGKRAAGKSLSSSSNISVGAWGGGSGSGSGGDDSEVTQVRPWKTEVSASGRSSAPCGLAVNVGTPFKTPAGAPKRFFWGPKAVCQRQEVDRDITRNNTGEPATFAMGVDVCPSTVSTIRSAVPRKWDGKHNDDDSTLGDCSSAYTGMEPYIRTSITDRVHDRIYDTDVGEKTSLAGRVKSGKICAPHISRHSERFDTVVRGSGPEITGPGHYEIASGIDATSTSSPFLPLPREACYYDSYIRRGLGQTSGSALGPGIYSLNKANPAQGPLAFSTIDRWSGTYPTTSKSAHNRGPWDDVDSAWCRGGYIEGSIPRKCDSFLPSEVMEYASDLDLDHLGKRTFLTAMRQNPKRYAASFSNTELPDWRNTGDPGRGPGKYAVERAEGLVFPSPVGGSGDADLGRPSIPFRARFTPFDTRSLADGYKTLKPRFCTPRSALHSSELSGPPRVAAPDDSSLTVTERTVGALLHAKRARKWPSPAAKAAAVNAVAAADPWGVGGRGSRFVRLERPSVIDPVRDGSRRRAAALTWKCSHNKGTGSRAHPAR